MSAKTQPAHALEAGAAKVDITPPLGTPLAGYFDRLGRGATAIHDPVWARCLYLDDGATNLFLITADLCAIPLDLRQEVVKVAPGVVPSERVILAATHTHNGPGAMARPLLYRSLAGRFLPEVLGATARKIANCMVEAYEARQRATIGYGVTKQSVLSSNLWRPEGPIDEQIGVMRVDDADGRAIAILANFAARPATVGEEDRFAVSADYVGYFYEELEGLSDTGCVALFTNGAAGNLGCGDPENNEGWARTESIGRLLAVRVKEVANRIDGKEARLHVGAATALLPPTLAEGFLPSSTLLRTLEVDDLLMTFFPGEPCVEIGLALRRRALEQGYKVQFTVSCANDYLFYFVPQASYGLPSPECAMSFYGPGIGEWFSSEFSKLMTRGRHKMGPEPVATPKIERVGPARRIILRGASYEIGYGRGVAFREALAEAFHGKVLDRVASREWIPKEGFWSQAPTFIDVTPLAVPALAVGTRPLLAEMAEGVFEELEGMAEGAELPFDALWLVQCAPVLASRPEGRDVSCTMFAAVGERAGADDLLVGCNFDWVEPDPPVIVEAHPATGHSFIHIGFPWNVGVFTGMNDAGLVLCLDRMEGLAGLSLDGPPLELVLRDLLQTVATLDEVLAVLSSLSHASGYQVLVADASSVSARVVELGDTVQIRKPADGLLLGIDPDAALANTDDTGRYARVRALLADERIIGVEEIEQVLGDTEAGQATRAQVYSEFTRHCVGFKPKSREVRVAFPSEGGGPGEFVTIALARSK